MVLQAQSTYLILNKALEQCKTICTIINYFQFIGQDSQMSPFLVSGLASEGNFISHSSTELRKEGGVAMCIPWAYPGADGSPGDCG